MQYFGPQELCHVVPCAAVQRYDVCHDSPGHRDCKIGLRSVFTPCDHLASRKSSRDGCFVKHAAHRTPQIQAEKVRQQKQSKQVGRGSVRNVCPSTCVHILVLRCCRTPGSTFDCSTSESTVNSYIFAIVMYPLPAECRRLLGLSSSVSIGCIVSSI